MQKEWFNTENMSNEDQITYYRVCNYTFIKNGDKCDNPDCKFIHPLEINEIKHNKQEFDTYIKISEKKFLDYIQWKIKEGHFQNWFNIKNGDKILTATETYIYWKVCMNVGRIEGCTNKKCNFIHSNDFPYKKMGIKKLADYYKNNIQNKNKNKNIKIQIKNIISFESDATSSGCDTTPQSTNSIFEKNTNINIPLTPDGSTKSYELSPESVCTLSQQFPYI
jgi:hypothetical protein